MGYTDLPKQIALGPGYVQLEFANFKQFVDYVYSDMLDFESYVWRGQRCESWTLEPTLDRLLRKLDVSSAASKSEFLKRHLEEFKYATRGRRGPNPPAMAHENDWWALGQHYGLPTPLLDWSNSPFVAAFFAFSDTGSEQTPDRAIFALHQPGVEFAVKLRQNLAYEEKKTKLEQGSKDGKLGIIGRAMLTAESVAEFEFIRPLSDENSRLVSQRGLFSRNHTALSIEEWVKANQPADDDGITLMKLLVPDTERSKCLQLLNRMNINPLSLFPDLAGASQYCTLLADIKNY